VREENLDGSLRLLGKKVADRQFAGAALAAEVGANVDRLNADLTCWNAGCLGELRTRAEGTFG